MNAQYHIVHISLNGYHLTYSFSADSLEDAARELVNGRWRWQSMAVVLRDGSTGQRYTVRDCQDMLGMGFSERLSA